MKTSERLKPGPYGVACGAIAVTVIGFNWAVGRPAARSVRWPPSSRELKWSRR